MTDSTQPLASSATPPPSVEDPEEVERRYMARVRDDYNSLDSEGVDNGEAELTKVFVMLEAVESPSREVVKDVAPVPERIKEMGLGERVAAALLGRDRSQKPDEPPPPPVPLAHALKAHNHLVILGEPGTGKSTVLQYITLGLAGEELAKKDLSLDEACIPVRVELRRYDPSVRLDEYLVSLISNHPAHISAAIAWDWLEHGRLAILLDGLDEVRETHRRDVAAQIAGFADHPKYQKCRIIVTSRIAGYQEIKSSKPGFGHFTICPLTGAKNQRDYVAGWLAALEPANQQTARDRAYVLVDRMQGQQGLHRVVSNPLLLRLAVAVYMETGEPPTNRSELYQRYVRDVALERAERREKSCWDPEHVECALEAVAWALQIHGQQEPRRLAELAKSSMPRAGNGSRPFDYLQQQMGLLADYGGREGPSQIAFRHLSFQEYFVARRLKRAWESDPDRAWRFLRPRLHHPGWREPILLLAQSLSEGDAADLAKRICRKAHSAYEHELQRDLLFSAAIVGEAPLMNGPTAASIAQRLRRLGLDSQRGRGYVLSLAMVGILVPVGLSALMLTSRPLAIKEIWGTPFVFGFALLVMWMLTRDELAYDPWSRVLMTLADRLEGKAWYDQLLQQTATSIVALPVELRQRTLDAILRKLGSSKVQRYQAGVILGEIGKLDPAGPPPKALHHRDEYVRGAAVLALKPSENPAALTAVISALEDSAVYVRLVAANQLGTIADEAAVLPLTRALADSSASVRYHAALSLGKQRGPGIVVLLINALEDPNPAVAGAAAMALGEHKDRRAVDPLIRLLGKKDEIRYSWFHTLVLRFFTSNEDAWVTPRLTEHYTDKSALRRVACMSLGQLGDASAIENLEVALNDTNWDVRHVAASAMAKIGGPQATKSLISAMQHSDWSVRLPAAQALFQSLHPEAAEVLRQAICDSNKHVRYLAVEQLEANLGTLEPLSQSGREATDLFVQAVGDSDKLVRRIAVRALGTVGSQQCMGALAEALHDPDRGVRLAAAISLGKRGDSRGWARIVEGIGCQRPDWRLESIRGLEGRIDAISATPAARSVARKLWLRLTDVGDIPDAAFGALSQVATRITELDVAALGDNPPVFGPGPEKRKLPVSLVIVLNVLVAGIFGLASDLLASSLGVPSNPIIPAVAFALSLGIMVLLTLRLGRTSG